MHYRPGEFVKAPEGTMFFVFESLEYADEFVGRFTERIKIFLPNKLVLGGAKFNDFE